MATDPSDPLAQIYNFFKHLYPASSPGSFFAFEQLGFPVNPANFQFDGAYLPPMAVEWLSGLANKAIVFQDGAIQHSSLTVDGLVGLMLNASMPDSANDMTTLGAAKLAAGNKFDTTAGSLSGIPNDTFHPVVASPVNWYDPGQAANWQSYPLAPQPSPPIPAPPTPPPPAPPPPAPPPPRTPVQVQPPPLHWKVPPAHEPPIVRVPGVPPHLPMVSPLASSPSVRATLTPVRLATMAHTSPSMVFTPVSQQHPISIVAREAPVRMLQLHDTLQQATVVSSTVVAQPVSGSNIFVSFDFCVVSLQWPWIDPAFLLLRDWYIPGYPQAAISNGSGLLDTGLLPALPTQFVMVRNLTIKGNWAQSDIDAINVSAGLGPFSLADKKFDPTTGLLSASGMQIVGWFCSAQPQLPPYADPHLTAAPAPSPVAVETVSDQVAQPVNV